MSKYDYAKLHTTPFMNFLKKDAVYINYREQAKMKYCAEKVKKMLESRIPLVWKGEKS